MSRLGIRAGSLLAALAVICFVGSSLVNGQATLLAVSAFQACVQASFAGASLNCTDTQKEVTVLDILVEPIDGPARSQFVFELTTLPPNAQTTQYSTSNECVAVGADGRCVVSDPTIITVTTTSPVLSYQLRPVVSGITNPFQVPYAYYYLLGLSKPSGSSNDDRCLFRRTYSSVKGGSPPNEQAILKTFQDPALNAQRIRCDPERGDAPTGVAGQCKTTLVYELECFKSSGKSYSQPAKLSAQFCQLAPTCTVYQIVNPPAVVGEITVSAYNARNGNVTIVLQNFGAGSSKSDPAGLMVVSVEAAVSVDAFYGPNMRGVIIMCNDDGSDTIDMVPDGSAPFVNPWTLAKNAGLLDPSYKLPVKEIIELLSGRPCGVHCLWYFVPPRLAQALGTTCGKYGVGPDIYSFIPDELFINYFSTIEVEDAVGIKLGDLTKIANVLTCVPGFGYEFLGLTSTTACSANSYFKKIMNNPLYTKPEHMPPGWDASDPNQWISNNRLFYSLGSELSGFELIIKTSGKFVGVKTSVVKASIDVDLSACWIDLSVTPPNGTIYLRVCNDAPDRGTRDNDAAFEVTTTCAVGSGLSPQARLFTEVIRPQTCIVQEIGVRVVSSTVQQNGRCTSTVYAAGSTVDPRSVIMQSVEVGCIANPSLPPPSSRAINISRLEPVVLPPPSSQNKGDTEDVLWGWIAFIGAVIVFVVIATLVITVLRVKSKGK
jgi:hypothetical protein